MHLTLRSVRRSRLTLVMLQKSSFCNGKTNNRVEEFCENDKSSEIIDYERAIHKLNTLQSNAASIRQSIINKKMLTNLDDTIKYLNRSGISLEDLDKLSVIHVSGTKGKGSTCALTESILREYGVRTGFFSSPHLVSVTERIRINGEAISKKKFAKIFWKVFNKLDKEKDSDSDFPAYFKFLTIMCFHVFFEEKVDVAIVEVGIGGEFDSTNIVRNTTTVGITTLGLEHTNILGDTIEDITIQKAGIIKPFARAYTNVKQPSCLEILKQVAAKKHAKLIPVPDISEYCWQKEIAKNNMNKMAELNGSLAIQLAYNWLRESGKTKGINEFSKKIMSDDIILSISDRVERAFSNCIWPGRCQIINFNNLRIHFDGAHTPESMNICVDWFESVTKESSNIPKILIFNATGERDSTALLNILSHKTNFDICCFVPNIPFNFNTVGDIHSVYSYQDQHRKAEFHEKSWCDIKKNGINEYGESRAFETILEAFLFLRKRIENNKVNILITGSIHLIGATIIALEEFEKCLKTQ